MKIRSLERDKQDLAESLRFSDLNTKKIDRIKAVVL